MKLNNNTGQPNNNSTPPSNGLPCFHSTTSITGNTVICEPLTRTVGQHVFIHPAFSVLIGGILPFGAVFIELFFILTSIWLNQFYYIFGFLFLVFIILVVTCAEITIVLCYFQLCSEDYLWWWRSYLTSGSSALYLFLYATFYFFTKLEITKLVSVIFYFGYMLIASYAFFMVTGTIG